MTKRPGPLMEDSYNDDALELPHEDFSAYCRLCFSISQLEPLFATRQDDNYQLIGMIEMCAGIKLSAKTDSPSSICLQCRLTMDEFFNFRKLCQRLNRVYRRKRNEAAVSKANAALEYHQGGAALVALAVPEVAVAEQVPVVHDIDPVAAEDISENPSPMEEDIKDETCATMVAPEPSALEASAVADGVAPESFIVHELSDEDEDDDDVQITSVDTIPVTFDLSEDNDDPFIKMANDWYCCKACSRLYQAFPQLVEHLRDVHPEKAETLRHRTKEPYFRVKDADLQTVQYGSNNYYKCDLCDTIWSSKTPIMRHRWRYHGAFDDCRKTYCREAGCESFFMDHQAVSRHLEVVHGRVRKARKKPAAVASAATNGGPPAGDSGVAHDDDVVLITNEYPQQVNAPPS